MKELIIPEAAERDNNSVEMVRVWIAEKRLHCSLNIGMYAETTGPSEEKAWGIILADVVRHLADGLTTGYGADKDKTVNLIKEGFLNELSRPTSKTVGNFKKPN